jgi:hypothetical protein
MYWRDVLFMIVGGNFFGNRRWTPINADKVKSVESELLKTSKPVRGELVEPHFSYATLLSFDKLRANGVFIDPAIKYVQFPPCSRVGGSLIPRSVS